MPGMGGVMADGMPMGAGMPSDQGAYNAAQDEMPF